MHMVKFLTTLVLLAVLLGAGPHVEASTRSGEILWLTYNDPRFDFSLEYPADWTVQARTDRLGAVGEVLTFISPASSEGTSSYSIAIGQYLYEIKPNEMLSNWTDSYPSEFSPSEIRTSMRRNLVVGGSAATFIRGASPITEYQYTNIRRGKTVWFVWANFGDSADSLSTDIYNHMVSSLKFGGKSPTTLQDIYGSDFQPRDLPAAPYQGAKKYSSGHLAAPALRPASLGSGWQSPVLNDSSGNPRTVN